MNTNRRFSKLLIESVVDVAAPYEQSRKFGYRVGRVCYIDESNIYPSEPATVYYDNKTFFKLPYVISINSDETFVKITTSHRIYLFKRLYVV